MTREDLSQILQSNSDTIAQIKDLAHQIHAAVNQHYDQSLPYSYHLDSVADCVIEYLDEICDRADDVVPVVFGAYFHDSIEDARLTYNNVMHLARKFMSETQAHMATEIVYALTNEKGRNRAERANNKYYEGIRSTPYAPLCKLADRLANVSYSASRAGTSSSAMRHVYLKENPHFITAIDGGGGADKRMHLPASMLERLNNLFKE